MSTTERVAQLYVIFEAEIAKHDCAYERIKALDKAGVLHRASFIVSTNHTDQTYFVGLYMDFICSTSTLSRHASGHSVAVASEEAARLGIEAIRAAFDKYAIENPPNPKTQIGVLEDRIRSLESTVAELRAQLNTKLQ